MGFVTVLLTILKILGIVLGSLLGLVLLLLVLVLFVPIRYRGDLAYSDQIEDSFSLKLKASYLLHIFSINFSLLHGDTDLKFKIFGITIDFEKIKENNSKRKKKKRKTKKKKKKTVQKQKKPETVDASTKKQVDVNSEKKIEEIPKQSEKKKKSVFKKLKELYNKFIDFWKRLKTKIKEILETKDRIVEFLENKENQEAFHVVLQGIGKILKHIMPRKHLVKMKFGLEDPSLTGKILGAIYATSALIGIRYDIEPNFEQKIIVVDAWAKGHIRIFSVLIIALKIYKNKKIKELVHKFMD